MSLTDLRIAVVGGASASPEVAQLAFDVGREIARRSGVLLCGGRGGVMQEAARGALAAGGRTIGIMPGASKKESPPNPSIQTPIFTGLGQARNLVLVLSGQAVVAVGGGWGTLSEIALAIKHRVPVVLLASWDTLRETAAGEPLLDVASTAKDAVDKAIIAARSREE